MLNLDEKKIRKGKPIGLPYQGSKKKISKKIVEIIKQNFGTDKPIYDFLKLLVNSFGNDKKSYLYSKGISDLKYNLAKEIIENHDVFSSYTQTETYKRSIVKLLRLQQLEQLQQLQQLQQLEQLQRLDEVKATNKSYHDFGEVSGAILYLDPPYEGSHQKGYINSFDSQEFYNWAFEMSKSNIVIISSYSISDERFEAVYSFDKAHSTLEGGTRNNRKIEKLFMVKNS